MMKITGTVFGQYCEGGQPTSAVPDRFKPVVDGQYTAVGTMSGARCGGRIFAEDDVGDVRRQTSPCGERLWKRRVNVEFT